MDGTDPSHLHHPEAQAEVTQCRYAVHCHICRHKDVTMQGGALSKLKRLSSSRLRNASGASPREQLGADSAQPDHFAAALEKLRRDRPAEKQNPQQQGAGHKASSKAPGESQVF